MATLANGTEIKVGDFLSQTLVTDSTAYYVVATTEKTITVTPAGRSNNVVRRDNNGSPYPVVWHEVVAPELDGTEARYVCRKRKGTGGFGVRGGRDLYPTTLIDGKPVTRTDYSY